MGGGVVDATPVYTIEMGYYIGYVISGLVIIAAIILAVVAQSKVSNAFNTFSKVPSSLDLTASQLAERMAMDYNLNIKIKRCRGRMTDHFNPSDNSISISDENFDSKSIAAQSIVAHEFGHALQCAKGYFPYKVRQFVVKTSNFISGFLLPLLLIGIFLQAFMVANMTGSIIIYVSIGLYAVSVLANLVTLPVEINASSRAKKIMYQMGCTSAEEVAATDKVLNAAALTYVAGLLVSLAYFARYLYLLLLMKND